MPLFRISENELTPIRQRNFDQEKTLQRLIESNLSPTFNCRFVATEFSTGSVHAGRIDTLALSEDGNPVIIEYKKVESSELINQSLFYLYWLRDHKGDFEIAASRALGSDIDIDWSEVRVICIAPNFKKYDIHAVQVMGANIELWKYRLFDNNTVYLEEVYQQSVSASPSTDGIDKNPIMVAAGKKAAITRATSTYSFDEHHASKPELVRDLLFRLREYIMNLDAAFEEVPKKHYIAYKISQNIACVEVQRRRLLVYLKLNPKEMDELPPFGRDVSEIGHYGTGDLELSVENSDQLDAAFPYVRSAYDRIGG